MNGKSTLRMDAIHTAAHLLLPGELSKHALYEGKKVLDKYKADQERENTSG